MRLKLAVSIAVVATAMSVSSMAGTLKSLVHQPPDGAVITMQLTDGTVMAQGYGQSDWWKLTPDNTGSYINGTWKQVASFPAGYAPYANAEAVLADGRLVIAGGEYNGGNFSFTNRSMIYDPLADKWTDITPDRRLLPYIGDSPSNVLPDGRFVVGEKFKKSVFAFDPKTMTWSELASTKKNDFNAEEGWLLLGDGSILTFDVKAHPNSERYIPATGVWVDAGSTVVDLRGPQTCCGNCIPYGPKGKCYDPPGEVGGSVLRPDGTVFATGSLPEGEQVAHTAIYTPPSKGDRHGHWTAGPDFPRGDDSFDAPDTILPSGNVLVESTSGNLYEFDGTSLIKQNVFAGGSLMNLPTGEVLIGGSEVYQPTGTYNQAWAPTISDSPASVTRGQTYQISGTQFNGVSQGASLGDEFDSHTNYPLVRITNKSTNHVFYARTHDHSTMGVQTGKTPVSTNFDVPSGAETGASKLEVVANGIPSKPVDVTVN
ncbi:MAG TPA: hypothetical protein VL286_01580 [Rhizomicrobium sp.]|nr:hypothetical protein [Rhizomicrobium sp.]